MAQNGTANSPSRATCSVCDNVDQLETFPPRSIREALVERDHLKRRGTSFGGKESRRELQRIGRPQRMNAKKPERVLANDLTGFDLVPSVGELFQPIEGKRGAFRIEQNGALEAGQG
jgi:hypothetical protein